MKGWDSDLEEEEGGAGAEKETSNGKEENGGRDIQGHLQKVQKLIYAAKVCDKNGYKHTAFDVELVGKNRAVFYTC